MNILVGHFSTKKVSSTGQRTFYFLLVLILTSSHAVGNFLHEELIPARKLEDTIPSLEGKDREAFLSFVSNMLTWLPEERMTARELMEHPFLQFGKK